MSNLLAEPTKQNESAEFYQTNGYYLAKGVFSPQEIKTLESEFDRIVSQVLGTGEDANATWKGGAMERLGAKNSVIFHTHNVQAYSALWLRAFLQDKFLGVSKALLGEDVVLHHSKLFQKPSEKGAPFPMHQDWEYFPTVKDTMLAGIIHVSKATDEMGCLRVYPGSHKLGRQANMSGGTKEENPLLRDTYPLEKATVVEAEPGDVLFFNYFTLHGSMPNRSSETRKTVLVQMHAGHDAIEEGNNHPNARLVLSGWNHTARRSSAAQA